MGQRKIARIGGRVGEDRRKRAEIVAGRAPQGGGRVGGFAQVTQCGEAGGDVDHTLLADGDHGRADAGAPGTAGEGTRGTVIGQAGGKGGLEISHGNSPRGLDRRSRRARGKSTGAALSAAGAIRQRGRH